MKNYLSFGGGVNSVAMYLLLLEQGVEFEAVFVDHGTDWPETYEYVSGFPYPLTTIEPEVEPVGESAFNSLIEYCEHKKIIPSFHRWCTDKFKIRPQRKYMQTPAFLCIGYDAGETHRAKIVSEKGFEHRYPLIESGLGRKGCKELIKHHGLEIPPKSGCYVCPWQRQGEWKRLRKEHPDLFCRAERLEKRCNEDRASRGKKPIYINGKCSVRAMVEETQYQLFKQDEYPPCECML